MKSLNFTVKWLCGMAVLMLLVGAWVTPAAAQAPERDDTRLEFGLKRTLLRVDVQQSHIEYTGEAADLAQEFIDHEKEAGHDTSTLEAALDNLRNKIQEAQESHNVAAQILDEKAGFDDDGQVTDPQQARETLDEAHRAMQDARQTLHSGKQDFRQALRDYRRDKRDQ